MTLFFTQGDGKHTAGSVSLDLDLLKPHSVSAAATADTPLLTRSDNQGPVELEYAYRKHHPCLQWLPTKLAEYIGENLQDELGFPDKLDATKWSVAELNSILQTHVVCGRDCCALHTFGCLEWESELYRGVMRARCYPFNMRGHRFHGLKRQVHSKPIAIQHLYSIYLGMHMGYPMFIQYLSLYCRTLWSLFLSIPLPCKTRQMYP